MTLTQCLRSAAIMGGLLIVTTFASHAQELRTWMHAETGDAWRLGYKGKGTSITVVDDFAGTLRFFGQVRSYEEYMRHGEWTRLQAAMVAPSAKIFSQDFRADRAVKLRKGRDVLNLSYGMMAAEGKESISWSKLESSIIAYATDGRAAVVKAAGNDAVAVGSATADGLVDYLNRDLIGKQAAIFVGALDDHGMTSKPASLAWYSNYSGSNETVQDRFLVVGVTGDSTGLYGTSFAAPIVSGYAAIVGSKFIKSNAIQITNQLLITARTDTISGYSKALHGRGEVSISRALAPLSIK